MHEENCLRLAEQFIYGRICLFCRELLTVIKMRDLSKYEF